MKPSVQRMLGFLGVLVLLVAAIIVYVSFIRPEYERINELRGEFATKTRFFEEQSKIIQNIQDYLTAKEVDIQKAQEPVSLALPTEIAASSLFYQLSELSRVNSLLLQSFGLNVLAIKPVPAGALIKGVGTAQIDLQLSGGYSSFKDFIAQLETNIRLTDLKNLTIKETAAKNVYDFILKVNTYYQTE